MGQVVWQEIIFNLTIIPPFFARGYACLWFVAAIVILYFLYPYIYLFIYGDNTCQTESVTLMRAALLVVLSCIYFWLVHKYDLEFWALIDRLLGRVPSFIIGAYLGHFVTAATYEADALRVSTSDARPTPFSAPASYAPLITTLLGVVSLIIFILYIFVIYSYPECNFVNVHWWWRIAMTGAAITGAFGLAWLFNRLTRFEWFKNTLGKLLVFCGGLSLEIYIAQHFMYWSKGVFPAVDGNINLVLVYFVCDIALAYLAKHLITKVIPA